MQISHLPKGVKEETKQTQLGAKQRRRRGVSFDLSKLRKSKPFLRSRGENKSTGEWVKDEDKQLMGGDC